MQDEDMEKLQDEDMEKLQDTVDLLFMGIIELAGGNEDKAHLAAKLIFLVVYLAYNTPLDVPPMGSESVKYIQERTGHFMARWQN